MQLLALSEFESMTTSRRRPPTAWPQLIARRPSRNEVPTIAPSLTSLLLQITPANSPYPVDDHKRRRHPPHRPPSATKSKREPPYSRSPQRPNSPAAPLPPGLTRQALGPHEGVSRVQRQGGSTAAPQPCTNDHSTDHPTTGFTDGLDIILPRIHDPPTLFSRAENTPPPGPPRSHLPKGPLPSQNSPRAPLLIPAFPSSSLKLSPPSCIATPSSHRRPLRRCWLGGWLSAWCIEFQEEKRKAGIWGARVPFWLGVGPLGRETLAGCFRLGDEAFEVSWCHG